MIQLINSSYPKHLILDFCAKSIGDTRPNAANMDPVDWENKPNTLMYLLYIEKRFDDPKAGYLIELEHGNIVAGHGWYPSDWDKNIYVESRAYTIPGRLKGLNVASASNTNLLTYLIEDIAITQGYLGGCVSLETYNESLADRGITLNNPTRYPLYRKEVKNGIVVKEWREPGIRMRQSYKCGPFNIKNTEQFVYYYLFDTTYKKEFLRKINEKTN